MPGLHGPWLLDDFANLEGLKSYAAGERSAWDVVVSNDSGPTGRPLSMASFVLDTYLFGESIWHAKRTNLILHLLNGVLAFVLLTLIGRRDSRSDIAAARRWRLLVPVVAACWILLPLNVSTVLYLVQRMTILSATFVLVGLITYLYARTLAASRATLANVLIWIVVPSLALAAALCKENGLLLPLLTAVLEFTFLARAGTPRSRSVKLYLFALVLAPILLGFALFLFDPQFILRGYAARDFTLIERLLTQPRVLWSYVAAILLPSQWSMGLFHDTYEISRNLFQPWTTLPALMSWVILFFGVWRARMAAAFLAFGTFFFLAGHTMESSVFGLEIYFEHRNYLPSLGLLLGVVGSGIWSVDHLSKNSQTARRLLISALVLVSLSYAWVTHARVSTWTSEAALYSAELARNPGSPRLRGILTTKALGEGDLKSAFEHIAAAERAWGSAQKSTVALWRISALCHFGARIPAQIYSDLELATNTRIESFTISAWRLMLMYIDSGRCANSDLDVPRLIGALEASLERTTMAPSQKEVWRTRHYLARLYTLQQRYDEAAAQALTAWRHSSNNIEAGILAFDLNLHAGRISVCREIFSVLRSRLNGGNQRHQRILAIYEEELEKAADVSLNPD